MSQPFVGQIALFPYNFAPRGWALCAGQLMAISQNTALFSLLGTMYGGNGTTNFALPDLQGRVPISAGQGPGLSNYSQGEPGGTENVTLLSTENASHNHSFNATTDGATVPAASGNQLAKGQAGSPHTGFTKANVYSSAAPNTSLSPTSAIAFAGSNLAHNNIQPYQVLGYYIALQGVFPARN
jgi:microcystin-dependent protein